MAKFLTTTFTSAYLEEIITNAIEYIYLVSPYLKISNNLRQRLVDADQRQVKIYIVYGKQELSQEQMGSLLKLTGLTLYFMENLHAKCYFNENNMIITSMNMYEFSEKNNREMGIAINAVEDQVLFLAAKKEVLSIVNHADIKSKNKIATVSNTTVNSSSFNELTYKNWKEITHNKLEEIFDTQVYCYDNKYTIEFKNNNHSLICGIVNVKGHNKFLVSKILTQKGYQQLKNMKTIVNSKEYYFSLYPGGNGDYAMAHLQYNTTLKTEALNFVYSEDLEPIYHTIVDFAEIINKWKW